jgi:type II secretory pathway component PulL
VVVALITAVGLVLVSIVSVTGQWLTSRNDRTLTHQEVDLLKKLDPDSGAAADVTAVIQSRIASWKASQHPH